MAGFDIRPISGLRDDKLPAEVTVPEVPKVPARFQGSRSALSAKGAAKIVTRKISTRSSISSNFLEKARKNGRLKLPDGDDARGHQPSQDLLAGDQEDQGRSDSPLRADRAVHPAGRRQPAAGDEAVAERRGRHVVLSASRAGAGAAGRAHRDAAQRRCAGEVDRRIAEDAALHGAAGVDLDGPVVLDDGRSRFGRSGRDRSRSAAGRDVRADSRRRAIGSRRSSIA